MFPDPIALDVLTLLRRKSAVSILTPGPVTPTPTVEVKEAFSPSPAMQQAAMGQGQPVPPGGMDPTMAGGAPPGVDPAAAAAGGQQPPADPNVPAGPDPTILELKQMMTQLIQQQQGGVGPNGKSNTVSMKLEPGHFQQMTHKIDNIEKVLTQMADQLGLQVPASELLNQTAPGQTPPMDPGQAGATPGGPPGAGAAGPGQPGSPPSMAQQLPSLPGMPPAVSKAANADSIARSAGMVSDLGRLGTGFVVSGSDTPKAGGSLVVKLATLAARSAGVKG